MKGRAHFSVMLPRRKFEAKGGMVLPSEIVGTGGLWLALVAAIAIAVIRRPSASTLAASVTPAFAALTLQVLHFAEEFATGFHTAFPERLGLQPWSATFFVAFNGVWLALWSAAIGAARTGRAPIAVAALLWFLAIAAMANAVAHPVLAWLAQDYFPGLATSPLLGLAGAILATRLAQRSGN